MTDGAFSVCPISSASPGWKNPVVERNLTGVKVQSVRMHVDGSGVIWALTKCRVCGEVHKYLAAEVVEGHAVCKSCQHHMSVEGAVFEPQLESDDVDEPEPATAPFPERRLDGS